jgi:hypothetical protein
MPAKQFGNRRKATRESVKGLAVVSDPFNNLLVKAVIADLSLTGVGVRLTSPQLDRCVDTTVFMLHLLIPAWQEPIVCYATIDRLVPLRVGKILGMKFVSISDESLALIRRHLECSPGRPEK